MLYRIQDGSVSLGGNLVLSHVDFEIRGNEKIAVVGRNGAGKSTLLKLIAGELDLDRDDKRSGPGVWQSRRLTVGMLGQQVFAHPERTVEEELLAGCPARDTYDRERYEYQQEYDRLFTGFGFAREDKKRKLESFSGGEQTRIGFIRLLLEKPDILLLDEPTNHLDIQALEWLEGYLGAYPHAVVMVSHDRFFLDRTAEVVYEISGRSLVRYPGNYTAYRQEKQRRLAAGQKAYQRQQEEISRLNQVIERFKHKPSKAAFARAKRKQLERMEQVEKPEADDVHLFTGEISPLVPGSKWVLDAKELKLGYDRQLLELSLRVRRGQKIGLIGPNGAGKTTFLKTVAGLVPALGGSCQLGSQITFGYFDQHAAQIRSEKTVVEHFGEQFPALTDKEVRSILGAFLFGGKEAARRVSALSGGEKARLVLAELLQSRPNLLLLDEPTNHMDVQAKETLESAFRAYTGTILFVSHDRYFIRQVAQSVLVFEDQAAYYYPFGYEHYLERCQRTGSGESIAAQVKAEDAALLAGMRAVPRAERHRLREIPEEEAYLDWKERLAREKMELAEAAYVQAEESCRGIREMWMAGLVETEALEDAGQRYEAAWGRWHEAVMEWYAAGSRPDVCFPPVFPAP